MHRFKLCSSHVNPRLSCPSRNLSARKFSSVKPPRTRFSTLTTAARMASAAQPNTNGATGLPPDLRFIDIGINITDPVFRGRYHGKQAHDDDLEAVLERARRYSVRRLVVTGSDLAESRAAVDLAAAHPGFCHATIGVHPCSAKHFLKDTSLLASLRALILSAARAGHCVAIGEIGLDYDRLFLTDKDTQLRYFEAQLDLAVELHGTRSSSSSGERLARPLPLFLHSRAAAADFKRLLAPRLAHLPARGVVHSFTGTEEEMRELVDLGLDIGVNGCSLKTEENLGVVRAIPLDRLQLETDGPWCEVRASSAGMKAFADGDGRFKVPRAVKKERWSGDCMVKGRNEPCTIGLVAEIVALVKGISLQEVSEAAWRNSVKMFGLEGDDDGGT